MGNKKITLKQGCFIAVGAYCIVMLVFWLCAHEQLNYRVDKTDMLKFENAIGEIMPGNVFTQNFKTNANSDLLYMSFPIATYSRDNNCDVLFSIYDSDNLLAEKSVNTLGHPDSANYDVYFDTPVTFEKDKLYRLSITCADSSPGNAVTIYMGRSFEAGKANVSVDLSPEMQVCANGNPLGYALCYSLCTRTHLSFGKFFPLIVIGLGVVFVTYLVYMNDCAKIGKTCLGLKLTSAFSRYKYLIKQLVSRDFKTKYKRSFLGVLWSFLNPLLMMTVQYIVFSTLFKSSIPNFALYLMIGIVCFNFFSECAGMCLGSITGNASLITKVYVPKYIYPVSRMLSSGINLLLSFIPLLIVMLITHVRFAKSMILLPIPIICLAAFSLGIGMILATMMVFFRDTQFLWGVISMIWMYVTPIIYPESILPQKYLFLFKLNPLYHIVRMVRTMFMDGVSPEPKAYLISIILSFGTLIIGAVIFKKNQDKFVLNI